MNQQGSDDVAMAIGLRVGPKTHRSDIQPGPAPDMSTAAAKSDATTGPYHGLAADVRQVSGAVGQHSIGAEYVWQFWTTSGPLILLDLVLLTLAIAAARQSLFLLGTGPAHDVSACFLPIATGFILLSGELGLYPGIRLSPVEELRRMVVAVTCMFAMWAVAVAILKGGIATQRWFLLLAYSSCTICLPIGRSWGRWILGQCSWWGFPTVVCGDDMAAIHLFEWLKSNRHLGLRPVGVIADADDLELEGDEDWYLGSWQDAGSLARNNGAYWGLVVSSGESAAEINHRVETHLSTLPHVQVLSELTGLPDHWGRHQPVEGLAGIHIQQNLLLPLPRISKRLMDVAISLLSGIVLAPIVLAIAVAVKVTSRGPIFYGHRRIGLHGDTFKAWKFRTMVIDADRVLEDYLQAHPELREEWEKDHKLKRDPRITSIGRVLRKLSLDELPQLWNVLIGEMSLVGPRPIVTAEVSKYGDSYWLYSIVKPGITGLWQVSGRNNTTYEERVEFDSYYVRNWSPWLDLYLLIRTVRIVLFAEGAY